MLQNYFKIAWRHLLKNKSYSMINIGGLATFTTERRQKEIGVRKVLGASEAQITWLLSREFLLLVVIAGVLAIPVAYWTMTRWLQDFAYRVELEGWVFVLAGLIVILTALLSVSYHALKSASMNPVVSLKMEG